MIPANYLSTFLRNKIDLLKKKSPIDSDGK